MNITSLCINQTMTESCAKDAIQSLGIDKVMILLGLFIAIVLVWMNLFVIMGTKKKTVVYYAGILIPSLIIVIGIIFVIILNSKLIIGMI